MSTNGSWVSVTERLPKMSDGDNKGYVMVFLRNDRQWGFPTRIGFGKWNRVKTRCHTHWMRCPKPPELLNKETKAQVSDTTMLPKD